MKIKILVKIKGKDKWDQTLIHMVNEQFGSAWCIPWPTVYAENWEAREIEKDLYLKDVNACRTCWNRMEGKKEKEKARMIVAEKKKIREAKKAYDSPLAVATRKLSAWNRLILETRREQ